MILFMVFVISCFSIYYFYFLEDSETIKEKKRLLGLISKKQNEREEAFQKLKSEYKLNPERLKILNLEFDELLEKLQNREITAVQALETYLAKSLEVTEEFNCVTEFVPNAKQVAEELDSLSKPKGPLHGLPFAVKDDHNIKGMDSTCGFAKNLYKPAKDTAVIVKILMDLGAIPFCKTNVPTTLASISTVNVIFGKTLNALNKKTSPGGSSGGSGCIVAAGGALLAVGSDVGGSLRVPAHNHGITTIKSTLTRLSSKDKVNCSPKVIGVAGVTGILAKDVKTLSKVYKLITQEKRQYAYDPTTVPLLWDEETFSSQRKLKFGYYKSIPLFPAMGDTPKTILKAKEYLESLGHTAVAFPMPNSFKLMKDINDVFFTKNTVQPLVSQFEVEPMSDAVKSYVQMMRLPRWFRRFLSHVFNCPWLKPIYSIRNASALIIGLDSEKTEDFIESFYRIKEARKEILSKMEELRVDLLLGPVMPFPAVGVDDAPQLASAACYTFIWNYLDFPAGVVKFGTESGKNIEAYDDEGDFFLKMAKKTFHNCKGMPIGVQIIGKPFNEETVLRIMGELQNQGEDC